jgi:hypothetical protein
MHIQQVLTLAVALSVSLILGGCAGVPKPQLQAYATAFDEVKAAATLVYEDAAPALTQARGTSATTLEFPVTLGPGSFDREGCGRLIASDVDLRTRCQTLLAIKGYNQALLDISIGKSQEQTKSLIANAMKSAQTALDLVPASVAVGLPVAAIGAALGPIQIILGEALKAQDREALLAILLKGEPQVQAAIEALRKDVDGLYGLQRAYAAQQLIRISNGMNSQLQLIVRRVQGAAPPTDPLAISLYGALSEKFERVFSTPEPSVRNEYRIKNLRFNSQAPAAPVVPIGPVPVLDAAAIQLMDGQLSSAAEYVTSFKAVGNRYQASVQALAGFDALLTSWDQSFKALVTASQQLFATGGGTEQALQSLAVLKDQARAIRDILDNK